MGATGVGLKLRRLSSIDEAAASAGRDPAAIRRVCNINGRITNGPTTSFLDGPVEHWVDELTKLSIEEGMDSYILWPTEADESQLQRFAQEVVPQVRARVEQHRRSADQQAMS